MMLTKYSKEIATSSTCLAKTESPALQYYLGTSVVQMELNVQPKFPISSETTPINTPRRALRAQKWYSPFHYGAGTTINAATGIGCSAKRQGGTVPFKDVSINFALALQ